MPVKVEWLGYRMVKKLWQYVKPFSSDTGALRTDRRTDRRTELLYQYRASVCWRAIKTEVSPRQPLKTLIFKPWKRSRIWGKRPVNRRLATGLHSHVWSFLTCKRLTAAYKKVMYNQRQVAATGAIIQPSNSKEGELKPLWLHFFILIAN